MPGKIKVKVLAGRNLPVMDRAGDTTDAFVEIKFGSVTHKTDVCRKTLNPHWCSTEWYRFEVDESELQDEPLQLRLMDHDTYSANDAIGKVVISLAPLLAREALNMKSTAGGPSAAVLSGWIPVFDTLHGIRGELNVIVKVELFSDFNKYKTSSCGVQFFHCPTIPPGYKATAIHGFVEELVVNDDPEYQWIDKIRTPRASNEARQVAFIKLSNQVQRLVGLKAAELGANAVVGYQQNFDLEGEAGVVARAIGTAVSLIPPPMPSQSLNIPSYTQQQLRKYLDILATDSESITDLNQYFQQHQDELSRLLNILSPKTDILDYTENVEDDEKSERGLTRQSSVRSYTGSLSIYQDDCVSQKSLMHISDDQTDLIELLKRNANSYSDSTCTALNKVKKIRSNLFTKRFNSTRARNSVKPEDQTSLQSSSSDTSRISLKDLKNEFRKLKCLRRLKLKKTITNNEDEGIGMASILARSVIHAHTSLACIAETQDSEHSPCPTIRWTGESEPTINISDDENKTLNKEIVLENESQDKPKLNVPEIHTSLNDIKEIGEISGPKRKLSVSCPGSPLVERSENLLKLPGEAGYFGSVSLSRDSSEVYSSSEEGDEESSDQNADVENAVESTSSVVQSVLNKQVRAELIEKMDRKLSILESTLPILKESISHIFIEDQRPYSILETSKSSPCFNKNEYETSKTLESVKPLKTDTGNVSPSSIQNNNENGNSHHSPYLKFHNLFSHKKISKSVSAPISPIEAENNGFVYRSSKKAKRQFSKLFESNLFKTISDYSLIHKKRPQPLKPALSQPESMTDCMSVQSEVPSYETALGSDYPHSNVTMYIGSEPVSRASVSGFSSQYYKDDSYNYDNKIINRDRTALNPTGIVHTAVETILIDKVQSLLIPLSPKVREKQFVDVINENLEKVEEAPKRQRFFETHLETESRSRLQENISTYTIKSESNQTFPPPISNSPSLKSKHIDQRVRSKSREREDKHDALITTAMKTMLIDKVQSLIPSTSVIIIGDQNENDTKSHVDDKKKSLIHTAIETILLNKVQALIPTSTKIIAPYQIRDKKHVFEVKHKKRNSCGLLHTAMDTMLQKKVQTLIPPVSAPVVGTRSKAKTLIAKEDISFENSKSRKIKPLGLGIETVVMDEDQALLPTTLTLAYVKGSVLKTEKNKATETLLIDKVNDPDSNSRGFKENEQTRYAAKDTSKKKEETKAPDSIFQSEIKIIVAEKDESLLPPSNKSQDLHNQSNLMERVIKTDINPFKQAITSETHIKEKKLTRQNSVHSLEEVSKESLIFKEIDAKISIPSRGTHSKPVLQHFHPILGGPHLDTIPSLPEGSWDHTQSLDIDGVEQTCDFQSECKCQECDSESNSASVCDNDNSHAACDVDRGERDSAKCEKERDSPRHARHESYDGREPVVTSSQPSQNASLNSTSIPLGIHRRSSDSDLSVTPKGNSQNASFGNAGSGSGTILKPSMNSSNLEMLEYPFLTMTDYPPGFVVHIGGTVCARSVKLVDAGGECAARAAWWTELRTELRAHARALRCNAVIAYTESAANCEDVCVLSASGTAAVINLDCDFGNDFDLPFPRSSACRSDDSEPEYCTLAHVPYSPGAGPYRAELSTCGVCRKARVPAVLLATCTKPGKLHSYAKAVTVTAVAARIRRAQPMSEPGARDISDQLPFLEYELHKLLLAKLRMQGANALFSLKTQLSIGERCVIALASGTAVRLVALPPPTPPRIKASEIDRDALEIQRALWDSFTANKAANGYDIGGSADQISNGLIIDPDAEEPPTLDLCVDKDACVLELDEAEDVETARALAARRMHMQVFTGSLKAAAGVPPHSFAQVWRARLVLPLQCGASAAAERHVARALEGVAYKLRRLQPCALVAPSFQIELPEDEIQLVVSGTAIPLLDPTKPEKTHVYIQKNNTQLSLQDVQSNGDHIGEGSNEVDDDDIFALDEEQIAKVTPPPVDFSEDKSLILNGQTAQASVSLTSLSYVSGSRVERRICALRLLFVRETTAVRELGGLSGFLHTFTCEVLAIVRAYTAALGGNALTSFYITQLMLQDNAHKNQGQCLLSVGGDVVHITY